MAPSAASGQLMARSLSHGGIAGIVVGVGIAVTVVFLLFLPFILRAFREVRYERRIAAEHAQMSYAGPQSFHGSGPAGPFYQPGHPVGPPFPGPPTFPYAAPYVGPHAGPQAPPPGSATTPGDNNSSEDGKGQVPPISTLSAPAAPAAPTAAIAPTAPLPPTSGENATAPNRSALPPGSAPIDTTMPPFAGAPPTAPMPRLPSPPPPPALEKGKTFPTFRTQQAPTWGLRDRSATFRSTGSSSLTRVIGRIFHHDSEDYGSANRGGMRSPARSRTDPIDRSPIDFPRSPIETVFDAHHRWLTTEQNIYADGTVPETSIFEVDPNNLTGASAEYYSGEPLSPAGDPSSDFLNPVSFGPEPPSWLQENIAKTAKFGVLGVAGSSKSPKPTTKRTDSNRTATTDNTWSPISPKSPPAEVKGSFMSEIGERGAEEETQQSSAARGASSPPSGSASVKAELSPEPVFPHSPSFRPLVASPAVPAPGTVNPRDVWAPATEDERFVHKTAELDRIEQSPTPPLATPPLATPPLATASSADAGPSPPADTASSAAPSPSETGGVDDVAEEADPVVVVSEQIVQPTKPSNAPIEEAPPVSQSTAKPDTSGFDITPAESMVDEPPAEDPKNAEAVGQADVRVNVDGGADSNAANPPTNAEVEQLLASSGYAGDGSFDYDFGQAVYAHNDLPMFNTDGKPAEIPAVQQSNGPVYWSMPNGVPMIAEPYMTPLPQGEMPDGLLTMPINGYNGGLPPQFPLFTPQSSPGQPTYPNGFGMQAKLDASGAPSNIPVPTIVGAPMTPPQPKRGSNFNSPLNVPGSDVPSGPVSPMSNQDSTPGRSQISSSSPRTFACDECGRVFDQIHKLNHHKRYHERPHECTVAGCGKRFGTKTHLDRHVNDKHSKSRKYHCTEEGCPYSVPGGKSFPRKDNWRRHMVNKHGVHPEHEPIEVIDQPMMEV